MEDVNEQVEVRLSKLKKLKDAGVNLYPNDYRPSHVTSQILSQFGSHTEEQLGKLPADIALGGRMVGIRSFGKASSSMALAVSMKSTPGAADHPAPQPA